MEYHLRDMGTNGVCRGQEDRANRGTRVLSKKVRNGVERRQDEGRKDVSRPDYWYGGLTGDGKPLTAGSVGRIRA